MKQLNDLSEELVKLGFATEMFEEVPGETVSDSLNVFVVPTSRYPSDTIWPPTDADTRWLWGANYEHSLPGDTDLIELATTVATTVRADHYLRIEEGRERA